MVKVEQTLNAAAKRAAMNWQATRANIAGQDCNEAYRLDLPSGFVVQVINISGVWNVMGEWRGFVHPWRCEVYLEHEALKTTPPHTTPEAAQQDIINSLISLYTDDMALLQKDVS